MAEDAIEPRGEIRGDLRAGIVASVIRNCNRSKKSDPIASPLDYMPELGNRRRKKQAFDKNAFREQLRALSTRTNKRQ